MSLYPKKLVKTLKIIIINGGSMKNLKSLFISGVAASGLMVSMHAFCATDMTPPKPIDNKVYDAMVGTWEGDSTMMGTKMHDVIKISWGLGHQFLIMQL